jgi:hypothetical protein
MTEEGITVKVSLFETETLQRVGEKLLGGEWGTRSRSIHHQLV